MPTHSPSPSGSRRLPVFLCAAHAAAFLSEVQRQTGHAWPREGAPLRMGCGVGAVFFVQRTAGGSIKVFDRRGGALLLQSQRGARGGVARYRGLR